MNVYPNITNKHIVYIANKYILIQVMMVNNGYNVKIVVDGCIVNVPIMILPMIWILNVLNVKKIINIYKLIKNKIKTIKNKILNL